MLSQHYLSKKEINRNNGLKIFPYLISGDTTCKFCVMSTFTDTHMHKLLLCNNLKTPPHICKRMSILKQILDTRLLTYLYLIECETIYKCYMWQTHLLLLCKITSISDILPSDFPGTSVPFCQCLLPAFMYVYCSMCAMGHSP